MDSSFEKNYAEEQEIRRQFHMADAQKNEEGRKAAVAAYQKFRDNITAQGDVYARIYRLYSRGQ